MRPLVRRSLVAVLPAVVAVLVAAVPAAGQDPTTLSIVEVATVRATPDAAELDATVRRRARTEAVARRRVERRISGLVAALREIGVPAEAIRTRSSEAFTQRRKGRRFGFAARGIEVRVDDLAQLDAVASALGGALEGGIDLIVSDPTDERAAATAIALERARARADAAAGALGLRVLGIRRIDLSPEFGYAYGTDDSEDGASGGGSLSVDIEVGQDDIAAAVAVVYEVGP